MIKLDHDPYTIRTAIIHDGTAVTDLSPGEVIELADLLYGHAGWLLACGVAGKDARIGPLEKLVDELEEDIPGIRAEYEANGIEGLAGFVTAWAWEDVQRQVEEEGECS